MRKHKWFRRIAPGILSVAMIMQTVFGSVPANVYATDVSSETVTEQGTDTEVPETEVTTTESGGITGSDAGSDATVTGQQEDATHPENYEGWLYSSCDGYSFADILAFANDGLELETYFQGTVLEGTDIDTLTLYVQEGYTIEQVVQELVARTTPAVGGTASESIPQLMGVDTTNIYSCSSCVRGGYVNNYDVYEIKLYGGVQAFCLNPGKAMSAGATFYSCDYWDLGISATAYQNLRKAIYVYANNTGTGLLVLQEVIWSIMSTGTYTFSGAPNDVRNDFAEHIASGTGMVNVYFYQATNSSYQNLITWAPATGTPVPQKGSVTVNKSSSSMTITNYNTNAYALSGAVYGLYSDAACTNLLESLTIGADGTAKSLDYNEGTYYVKEITAPSGYLLNTEVLSATITATVTTPVQSNETPKTGSFSMTKQSVYPTYFTTNTNYSLEGAEYSVEYTSGDGIYIPAGTFKTNASGVGVVTSNRWNSANVGSTVMDTLPIGSYRVTETKASKGYGLDTTVYTFDVTASNYGETKSWTSEEPPVVPALSMQKVSANTDLTKNNACYSLEGATYQVYTDSACTKEARAIKVGSDGTIQGRTDAVLTTNAKGNSNTLRLAAGIYYVKETKASKGYLIDDTVHKVDLSNLADGEKATFTSKEVPLNDPAHIQINKTDSEGITMLMNGEGEDKVTAIGDASLEGAVFKVCYYNDYYDSESVENATPTRTWYIETKYSEKYNGFIASLDSDYLSSDYTSSEFYLDGDGDITLPLGTVTYEEVSASSGYLKIGEGGVMTNAAGTVDGNKTVMQIRVDNEKNPTAAHPYVQGADDTGFETNSDDVPVRVFTTPQTGSAIEIAEQIKRGDFSFTKEEYVTGKGMEHVFFRVTASSGESHIIMTGADGVYSSADVANTANTNGFDELYALLVDDDPDNDYVNGVHITEMECGLWFYGTADTDEWNTANVSDDTGAMRYDEEYTIEELPCPANKGKQMMIAKTLSITEDSAVVDDGTYTNVPTPSIHTLEWDAETESHVSLNGDTTTINDTITYKYLTAGATYTAKGIAMELNSKGEVVGPLRDSDGNYIRANKTFTTDAEYEKTPQEACGTVDTVYTFSSSTLSGKKFVLYEYIFAGEDSSLITVDSNGNVDETGVLTVNGEVVKHTDHTDVNQIGYFLDIKTNAWSTDTEINLAMISDNMQIMDTVSYYLLSAGTQYKLVAELKYVDADGMVQDVLDMNGNPVKAEMYFAPDSADGSVDVKLPAFDGTQLLDSDGNAVCDGVVVYETLMLNDRVLVSHCNPDDADQTVWIPRVRTTALDTKTESHISKAEEQMEHVDTVQYWNLVPGKTYTVEGTLMDQETGEPLLDADGNRITAGETFMAASADGSIDITFTYDGSLLAGTTVVAFEDLKYNGRKVATHADINDRGQTIDIPGIHTELTNKDGSHTEILETETVVLTDRVSYTHLTAGEEYSLKGVLMNKKTGKPVMVDGSQLVATRTFVAEEADGETEVVFTFNVMNSDLADENGDFSDVVAFESLTHDGIEVAVHADINDEGQTMTLGRRGRVHVIKTGPFISGTDVFKVKLPDGQVQEVTRLSYEQLPFAGITFTVYNAETDEAVTSFTTNADGVAVSDYITFDSSDSFYMMETGTPAGLVQSTEKYPVVFENYDSEDVSYNTDVLEIDNAVTGARINVYKRGEFIIPNTTDGYGIAQKGIEGVYFGVYADEDITDNAGTVVIEKDTLVGIAKTNEEGVASIRESLVAGKYYFMEIMTATEEYELDETRFDFEVTYERNSAEEEAVFNVNAENPQLNEYKTQDAEIKKTDGDGNALAGVEFALYRKYNGEYRQIGLYTTAENGKIFIKNIPYGEYYWLETKGLDGYEFDGTTQYHFVISDDVPEGTVVSVEAVNAKIPETPGTPDTPGTGDTFNIALVLAVLAAAGAGLAFLLSRRRKNG